MHDGVFYMESHEAAQFFRYHGDVPDVVGKWVLVVRAGAPAKESWVFCDKDKIEKVKRKYLDRFIRVAGKVYIDRKPIRVPKVEDYAVQLSAREEEMLLASLDEPKPLGSMEWQDTKSKAPEYNPLLDIPKLAKGLSTLSENERKVFDLWNEGKSQYAVQAILKIDRASLLSYRNTLRRKLKDYLVANDAKDFERRVQSIHPTVKKLVDGEIKKNLIVERKELEERRKAAEQEKLASKQQLAELRKIEKLRKVSGAKENRLQARISERIPKKVIQKFANKKPTIKKTLTDFNPSDYVVEVANALPHLTKSERRFFDQWVGGLGVYDIERILNISHNTAKDYQKIIRGKLTPFIRATSATDFNERFARISNELAEYLDTHQVQPSDTIDPCRLVQGLANLDHKERKYFDLLLEGASLPEILQALKIPNGAHLACVKVIKRKLEEFLPEAVMRDFDAQIKLIGPSLKKQLASRASFKTLPGVASINVTSAPIPSVVLPNQTITFNDFIQAYGNRKDALKALEQFNRIPTEQRPLIMADIPKYKASLVNAAYQASPYQYLIGKSWMNTES